MPSVVRHIPSLTAGLLIVATIAVGGQPSPAMAGVQSTFYASPTGTGTACTVSAPCTLSAAQTAVRALTATMTGNIVVTLAAGEYPAGLALGAQDSGQNGHRVIYQADPGAATGAVKVSGGTQLTGWTPKSGAGALNIYEAAVPEGFDTRQLYVNGVRASVASKPSSEVLGTMAKTATGISFTATGPSSWSSPERLELVFHPHFPWTHAMCPVTGITSGALVVAQPCFDAAFGVMQVNLPTEIQNNIALLTEPGQFYVDTDLNKAYYIPRPGEDLATASVIGAGAEVLLSGQNVSNLSVQGISFVYSTMLIDSRGVLDAQANGLANINNLQDQRMLPAGVLCHGCQNVEFRNNVFEHMGGSGLQLDQGGVSNSVVGNVFRDISGNGINIGVTYQMTPDWQPAAYEDGTTISNNYLFDIANEYLGGVGIFAGWVKNTVISHNEIGAVSYSGISLGFGAGYHGTSQMANNHIDYNFVHDVVTSSVHDGGGIYVNGTHQTPRSSMTGNHVQNLGSQYASLYLDDGASNWDVSGNVVDGYSPNWLLSKANSNTATGNYVWWRSHGVLGTGGAAVSGNFVGLTSWPAAAEAIMASAGLEAAFASIRPGGRETNLAWDAAVTASSFDSAGVVPSLAVDGFNGQPGGFNGWIGVGSAWWQVDLGAPADLAKIEILFRQDGLYYPNQQKSFRVLVSNSPSVTSGFTEACIRIEAMAMSARFDCDPPAGQWRYVTIARTDVAAQAFTIGEVRVYGHAATPAAELRPLTYNTSSATWSALPGRAGRRVAVDSTGTPWVVDWAGHLQRWTGYGWATVRQGDVQDVALGGSGTVAIVQAGTGAVLRSSDSGSTWTDTVGSGAAYAVAIDAAGDTWAVRTNGQLWRLTGATWSQVATPGGVSATDVGAVGNTITITTDVSNQRYLYVLDATGWTFAWGQGIALAGDANGYITTLGSTGVAYRGKAPFALSGTWSTVRSTPGAGDVGVGASTGTIWIVAK